MEKIPEMDELLTLAEVADKLRCNRRTVLRYINQEKNPLKAEKHSERRTMVRTSDLKKFRENSRQ